MIDTPDTPTVHASQGQHWYRRSDAAPMYEVPRADGKGMRPASLRDARKMDLVPGVSSIIACAAQPGLQVWKDQQLLLAALTLPRRSWAGLTPDGALTVMHEESEAEWVARVKLDAAEQARAAAERGTEIHAAIESFYREGLSAFASMDDGLVECTGIVVAEIGNYFGDVPWEAEQTFATDSFGGKADLCSVYGEGSFTDAIIDIKGKDNRDFEMQPNGALKKLAWDEQAMQLAAYRQGLGRPEARCADVFVSREAPWQTRVVEWPEKDLQRGWRQFKALKDFWYAKTGLGEDA